MTRSSRTDAHSLRRCVHADCIVCRPHAAGGFGLRFEVRDDGSVAAQFDCDAHYQGYTGHVHGGVVALLLDAAMTHCLFARGLPGVTARMDLRYRKPVAVGVVATVIGRLDNAKPPLYIVAGELWQDDAKCVTATARFFCEA